MSLVKQIICIIFTIYYVRLIDCGKTPIIKEHPKSVITRKNDPVTLDCSASEGSKIRWYKNGKVILDKDRAHRFVLDNGSLFFLRVTDSKKDNDNGVYWCEALNEFGQIRSNKATLTVATIGNEFAKIPESNIYAEGNQPLRLPCVPPIGVPPPSVRWKSNGHFVTNTSRIFTELDGSLVFSQVYQEDGGDYVCVASNAAGSKESSVTNLQVIYAPWFKERPEDVTAIAGTSVQFKCKARGTPSPNVSWKRSGGKIPLSRAQINKENSLILQETLPSDSGTYICEARNEAGSVESHVTLNIADAPVFKERPHDSVVLSGESLKLNCHVTGIPNPLTIWHLPFEINKYLLPGQKKSRFHVSSNNSEMINSNAQFNDTGLYQCWGISLGGGISSYAQVVVIESYPPPLIGIRPQDHHVSLGSTVTFPCEVVSEMSDEAKVTWWFQRASHLPIKEIISKGTSTILPNGALILNHITEDDIGIYKCKVKSYGGYQVEAEAFLKVAEQYQAQNAKQVIVPAPPSKPKIMNYNSTSVQLSWLPNSRRVNLKSVSYNIEYWRSPWQEWRLALTDINEESCIVTGLLPNQAYIFLVRAVGDQRESFPSPWSNFVYTSNRIFDLQEERTARRKLSRTKISFSSVKIMTSDTVLLSWVLQEIEIKIDGIIAFVVCEGSINRTVVLGDSTSTHVHDLEPNKEYTFFLVPFWGEVQGVPSNSKVIVTPAAAPKISQSGISTQIYENGVVLLQWDALPKLHANKEVIGYKISFTCNGSTTIYDTVKPWFKSLGLMPCLYIVNVASVTQDGIGTWSAPELVSLPQVSTFQAGVSDLNELVPSIHYPPPHPVWILYLLIPAIVLVFVLAIFFFRKFRRKSGTSTLDRNPANNLFPESSLFHHHPSPRIPHPAKSWRQLDSDKDSSISSTKLLRSDHLINEYSEPGFKKVLNDTTEPYATSALLGPSTPRVCLSPASWRYARCVDENGVQVNWAAILPPPPSSPPPPQNDSSFNSACTTSSASENNSKCCHHCTKGDGDVYERPCDATSEHTYAVFSPKETSGRFSTLQGAQLSPMDYHSINAPLPKSI